MSNGIFISYLSYSDSSNGNALTKVTVNGTASASFVYDADGNMTKDGQTGVEIEYNVLNLPSRVFAGSDEIKYIYSANGEKLASVVGSSSTYYRSVMTYAKNGTGSEQLLYIMHPEGLVAKESSAWMYKYFKTDHLGSTRALLAARGTSLTKEQSTDFYPFGLAHSTNNLHLNRYLYAGKEIQDASIGGAILGLYDFHARYYNPMLGRWFNIDPALQFANPYLYCGNNPVCFVDPDGELAWFVIPLIVAGVFGVGNTAAHAIRGDINNVGDAFKYFTQGAVAGFALGCAWQFAPLIPGVGHGIQAAMTKYAYAQIGLGAAGMIGGAVQGGWNGLGRGAQAFLGNFYLDENSWGGGIWQGFTRHTWEMYQTMVGHGYTQVRNTGGRVDRIDYLGGATFATRYGEGSQGVSIGNFINIRYSGVDRWTRRTFDDFVITHPLYMHEYAHSIDSRKKGPLYLLETGIPSLISAAGSKQIQGEPAGVTTHDFRRYEMSANRRAKKYFGKHYGVDWNTPYGNYGNTYETYYPTVKR